MRLEIGNLRFEILRTPVGTSIAVAFLATLLGAGCARPAGVIFAALPNTPAWPGPPEIPRIRYVGQLATDADLKPGRSFFQGIGETLFGKGETRSMLSPFAVCTDGGDRVFVADSNAQLVHVFNLKTRKYQQWRPGSKEPPFAQPVGIVYDARTARLLVADSVAQALFAFDDQGKYLGQLGAGHLQRPCGIAIHPTTGRIYVADITAHQIVVLDAGGQEVARIGKRGAAPGQFNYPTAVAIDRQGRLYVSDSLNFRVQQIAPDMTTSRIIGSKGEMPGYFSQPRSLALDSADHLYVVDNRFEVVQMFDGDGKLLMDFGEEGTGPGQFWLPAGIFVDAHDRIWIADSYNRRVQVLDYLPEAKP